jgi:TonB family protein
MSEPMNIGALVCVLLTCCSVTVGQKAALGLSGDDTTIKLPGTQSFATDVAAGGPYEWKHPEYPKHALENKLQGSVVLRLSLDEKGRVIDSSVLSGDSEFNDAATRAVRKWKFSPYFVGDKPVKVTTLVTIDFKIDGSGRPQIAAIYKDPVGDTIFKVGQGVTAPKLIRSPDPHYPEEALRERNQGACVLSLVVGPDGRTYRIKVVHSLGKDLDDAAIDAVKDWIFSPATKGGTPVAVAVAVEVRFQL